MTNQVVQNARDSLGRCMANDGFLDSFYERLLSTSAEVKAKFEGTDFERQKDVLEQSLYLMLVSSGADSGPAYEQMRRIGKIHSRGQRDIPPEMYDVWLETLMDTVREYDGLYTPQLEQDWRVAIKPGIDLLISLY